MNRPSNQSVERHYFEQFRRDYVLPVGEVFYTDKPDVIIRGPRTIGIEITNLYLASGRNPQSEQVQRHRRIRVLEVAQRMFLAASGKNTELSVDFSSAHAIHEVEAVASSLAELALVLADEPTGQVNPQRFKHIPSVRSVYHNATEYLDAKWRTVQSYTVPTLSPDRLREVVKEKSDKQAAYQPCDSYWLLVVIDFMDFAQDQHLEWPQEQGLGESLYERVLLYKPQFHQVVEAPR